MEIVIQTKSYRVVKLTKDGQRRAQLYQEKHVCRFCLQPIGKEEKEVREVHERCYAVIRRGEKNGEWTDEEMQIQGLWAKPDRSGRPPRQPTPLPEAS